MGLPVETAQTPPPPPPPDKPSFERVIQALRRAMWNAGTAAASAQGAPKAWVGGVDDAGLVIVNVEVDESLVQLKLPDLQTLAMIVGQPLKPLRTADSLKLPFASKTGPKLEAKPH